jgi:fused signal recognition particle receptor
MFKSLKEKLKNWIKSSSEKIEENIEEAPEEEKEELEETKKTKKKEKAVKKTKEKQKETTKNPKKGKTKVKTEEELEEEKESKKEIEEEKEEIEEKEPKKEEEIPEELEIKESEIKSEEEKEESEVKEEVKKESFFSKFKKKFKKEEVEEKSEREIPKEVEKRELKEKQEVEEELKEKVEKKQSIFSKIISKHRITNDEFNEISEGLEMLLLENNVALEVVEDIKKILAKKLVDKEISKKELENEIKRELKNTLNEILIDPDDPINAIKLKENKPFVILFFGINGTGKTTSIAKIASLLKKNNLSVVLAAADTFRAASIEQIQIHADKLNVPLVKQNYGSDPSAVGFDAIKYAKNHKIDIVLIDTAGRMHTKTNLISEMEKICRVTNPDLKIFVAESIAGNDATEQAKTFNEAIEIDGSILSKTDVDEKGGTIISVSHATKKPIFYLGTGQNYEDIKLFNKQDFIDKLGLD